MPCKPQLQGPRDNERSGTEIAYRMYARANIHVCVYSHLALVRTRTHMYAHAATSMFAYAYMGKHTFVCACMHACMHGYRETRPSQKDRPRDRQNVSMWMCIYVTMYIYTYTCISTYLDCTSAVCGSRHSVTALFLPVSCASLKDRALHYFR